jgi:putative glycosyltransferase (TIGR04348 family)
VRIRLVTPAGSESRAGNRVTAERWAGILRRLGHRVVVETEYQGGAGDLLVALHARRSAPSIRRWKRERPEAPVVVGLAGTDLYPRLSRVGRRSVAAADRVVALQPLAARKVPPRDRSKVRTILQSAVPAPVAPRRGLVPTVLVLGHLRPVKDPFRAAMAARRLPVDERPFVLQAGAALGPAMARRALAEMRRNDLYLWAGDLPPSRVRRLLRRCRLLVLSSRHEGGANVIGEAVVAGLPVLASRIPGSVGLLGPDYPGYFPVGDTAALARLMRRTQREPAFYERLLRHVERLAPLFAPEREERAWDRLLREIAPRESPRQNPRPWLAGRSIP